MHNNSLIYIPNQSSRPSKRLQAKERWARHVFRKSNCVLMRLGAVMSNLKDVDLKDVVISTFASSINPVPTKRFRIRHSKGNIVQHNVPKFLGRASKKTNSVVSSKLTREQRLELIEKLSKRKAFARRKLRLSAFGNSSVSDKTTLLTVSAGDNS